MLMFLPTLSFASVPGAAQDGAAAPTHFILCLNDGQQVTFVLEHSPKVVNGDGMITVVDQDATIEYPLDTVHKYMMGTDSSTDGIENVLNSEKNTRGEIAYKAGDVILNGFEPSVPVMVSDINGISLASLATDNNGYLVLDMAQYPAGIYIVKVQNKTFKFIKR